MISAIENCMLSIISAYGLRSAQLICEKREHTTLTGCILSYLLFEWIRQWHWFIPSGSYFNYR